ARRPHILHRRARRSHRRGGDARRRRRSRRRPLQRHRPVQPRPRRVSRMSKEILDAVRALAAEKSISSEKLMVALEGAIANVDPETGEAREEVAPELDLEKLKAYEDQIERVDVTPEDFGRIAAQTAKQVILQRIREAERDMMFEEYRDRVGELITGIVQQSDSRYTLVQLRERVEALLPKSEQVDGERY